MWMTLGIDFYLLDWIHGTAAYIRHTLCYVIHFYTDSCCDLFTAYHDNFCKDIAYISEDNADLSDLPYNYKDFC